MAAEFLNPVPHLRLRFDGIDHAIPPKVSYLTIFNPNFSKNDTDEGLLEQILCYINNDSSKSHDDIDTNVKLRQIGLIQGICNFAKEFSQGQPIDHIDTDQRRIVIQKFEDNFYIVACIELTKFTDNDFGSDSDDDNGHNDDRSIGNSGRKHIQKNVKIEYSTANLSSPAALCQDIKNAYNLFKLHYGTFSLMLNNHSSEFVKEHLRQWWSTFVSLWDLSINGKGYLKLLNSYKLSSKSISYSNSSNIKSINLILEKLSEFFQLNSSKLIDLLIYNPLDLELLSKSNSSGATNNGHNEESSDPIARHLIEEYGIVFKGFDIISEDSLIDLFNWLEENNFSGKNASGLLYDNYNKTTGANPESILQNRDEYEDGNVYFNPFSATFNSISSFFGSNKDGPTQHLQSTQKIDQNAASDSQIENLNHLLKQISHKKQVTKGSYMIGLHPKDPASNIATPNLSANPSPNPNKLLNSPLNLVEISFKPIFIKLSEKEDGSDGYSFNNDTVTSSEGRTSHSSHSKKRDEELLKCSLVVYEIGGLLFVMVFEDDYNELNNVMFYEQLEENIVELFESVDEFFQDNYSHDQKHGRNNKQQLATAEHSKNQRQIESKAGNNFTDYLSLKTFLLPFGMYFNNDLTDTSKATKTTDEYLRGHIEEDKQKLEKYKSSFYYIVYVPELSFYQTSLPIISSSESFMLGGSGENALSDSGFLDPKYTFDLQASRIQALHLHGQLVAQFNLQEFNSKAVSEKLANTEKFWWIYFSRFGGASGKSADEERQKKTQAQSTATNYYDTNRFERQVFILKKFSSSRKNRNLLFTDKSEDFVSMLGSNVKIWFDNCVHTGRV